VSGRIAARARFAATFLGFAGLWDEAADLGVDRFFADFVIWISVSFRAAIGLHRRSPAEAIEPAGRDPGAPQRPIATTATLQSRRNASVFRIILLLSLAGIRRMMIKTSGVPYREFESHSLRHRQSICPYFIELSDELTGSTPQLNPHNFVAAGFDFCL
jgi:hypothetical protein